MQRTTSAKGGQGGHGGGKLMGGGAWQYGMGNRTK